MAHVQRPVPCDTCVDEEPGAYYCRECKKTLCGDCEKAHNKFTKGHKVVLRAQIGEVDTPIPTCPDHGVEASLHCDKCDVPVCIECVTGNHQGHKMVNLNNIVEIKKRLLHVNIDKIRNVVLPNLERQKERIKSERETYNKDVQEVTDNMEITNQALHNELDRVHQERLKSLCYTRQNNLLKFDEHVLEIEREIDQCKIRCSKYQDAIRDNSIPAIINMAARKCPVPMVQSIPTFPKAPFFNPPNLQNIIKNLGTLQYVSTQIPIPLRHTTPTIISKFQSPLRGWPRICLSEKGDVWLGGHETNTIVMVDIKGQVVRRRDLKKKPYGIAIMKSGDIIVSPHDEYELELRLQTDGKVQRIFNAYPSKSMGLSVTYHQDILICTYDGRVIRSNSDGSYTKLVHKGPGERSAYHAVENADGNIYIADNMNASILMINKNGRDRTKITETSKGQNFRSLTGLAVDNIGNILCADKDNNCVYILDRNYHLNELLGRHYDIERPCFMVVDGQNNLWITQKDGKILVVKYLM